MSGFALPLQGYSTWFCFYLKKKKTNLGNTLPPLEAMQRQNLQGAEPPSP